MTDQAETDALADAICRYLDWQKQREEFKESKRLERQRRRESEESEDLEGSD